MKPAKKKAAAPPPATKSASRLIDQRIRDLGGWRGQTLARMRALILVADPAMTEEWKWRGTPVWSHDGRQSLRVDVMFGPEFHVAHELASALQRASWIGNLGAAKEPDVEHRRRSRA